MFPFFLARWPFSALAGAGAAIPPKARAFLLPTSFVSNLSTSHTALFNLESFAPMDKKSREALQVAKELTCKFIETRTVSPGNFAEVFPLIYKVVAQTILENSTEDSD